MSDTPPDPIPSDGPKGTALAKAQPVADTGSVLAIIPRSIEEAQRFASGLIAADIVPDAFRVSGKNSAPNAPLVLMGVLKSMEVGLPPITGIGALLPINNRFAIWGDGAVGLVQSKGLVKNQTARSTGSGFDPATELADWPDTFGWDVRYWRRGQEEPYIGRFTVRDAKRAGLWLNPRKQPWVLYPERMLFNRARAFALRDGFADALMGLGIVEEERDRLPDVDGGDLRPEGPKAIPSFLSDEEELPTDLGPRREPEPVERDLATDADLQNRDF